MEDINYGTGNETLWKCNSCGVLLALGAIIVAALSSDGYVAMEFKNTLTGFFDNMNALRP